MEKQSQNPMAVEPIPRLMARIGTPIVLSMILQAAYNVVDSAYLARMADGGEAALTALSLAFPVQLFMVAVSIGTGVGTNALLARLLGQGDREQANRTVGNAQFIALCITVVFMLFAAVGVRPYVYSQSAGGSIGRDILESAIAYLHICCGVPVGIVMFSVYEKVLQATGRSLYSTIAQITGAVVNIMAYSACPPWGCAVPRGPQCWASSSPWDWGFSSTCILIRKSPTASVTGGHRGLPSCAFTPSVCPPSFPRRC